MDNNQSEQSMQESRGAEETQTMPLLSKGKGRGNGPVGPPPGPPTTAPTSKGRGKGPPAPPSGPKGAGKGYELSWKAKQVLKRQADAAAMAAAARTAVPSGPKFLVIARLMDGREVELSLSAQDIGRTAKQQIQDELGISASRLKLIAGTDILGDFVKVSDVGIDEGSEISVVILSPLHGSLNRSGLDVPVDVMEKKMELHSSMLASALLRQKGVVA